MVCLEVEFTTPIRGFLQGVRVATTRFARMVELGLGKQF